ncbi:hypothetical protein PENTCL1PPCAC_19452, partial [Pristionchus entomophagus]
RMGESSRRSHRKRQSARKDRRSKPASEEEVPCSPYYELSKDAYGNHLIVTKNTRRRLTYLEPNPEMRRDTADSPNGRAVESERKKRSTREKNDSPEKRYGNHRDARPPPTPDVPKESQYIKLSSGSPEKEEAAEERKVSKNPIGEYNAYVEVKKLEAEKRSMHFKAEGEAPSAADLCEEYSQFYIGFHSRHAVDKMLIPGEFKLYYERPTGGKLPTTINLTLAYYCKEALARLHMPIQCYLAPNGQKYYIVLQSKHEGKMFASLNQLVLNFLNAGY